MTSGIKFNFDNFLCHISYQPRAKAGGSRLYVKVLTYTKNWISHVAFEREVETSIFFWDSPGATNLELIECPTSINFEELPILSYTVKQGDGHHFTVTANYESNLKCLPLTSVKDNSAAVQIVLFRNMRFLQYLTDNQDQYDPNEAAHGPYSSSDNNYPFICLPSHHKLDIGSLICYPPQLTDYTASILANKKLARHYSNPVNYLEYLKKVSSEFTAYNGGDSEIFTLVSGIDSFIPDLVLGTAATPIHYCKPNPQGYFQQMLVRHFYCSLRRDLETCDSSDAKRIFSDYNHHLLVATQQDPLITNKTELNSRINMLRCDIALAYTTSESVKTRSDHHRGIYLVRGNMISPYQSFNGTLQRDHPYPIGFFRGIVRRGIIGKSFIVFYYSLLRLLYTQEDALIRLYMILTDNPFQNRGIFELRIPSFSFFFKKLPLADRRIYDAAHLARLATELRTEEPAVALLLATLIRVSIYSYEIARDYMYYPSNIRYTDLASTSIGLLNQTVDVVPFGDILSPKSKVYSVLRLITGVGFRHYVKSTIACMSRPEKMYINQYFGYQNLILRIKQLLHR